MTSSNASTIDTGSDITMATHFNNHTITTESTLSINTTLEDSDIFINRTVTDYMSPWKHHDDRVELGTSVIVAIALGSAAFIIVVGKLENSILFVYNLNFMLHFQRLALSSSTKF